MGLLVEFYILLFIFCLYDFRRTNCTEYVFKDETARLTNETLDSIIITSEIRASIMDLKNEKSPGLDGIPAEFFKVACDTFLPYFEILFNNF